MWATDTVIKKSLTHFKPLRENMITDKPLV